jgi:hypothetical protein
MTKIVFISTLLTISIIWCQVNTEAMRSDDQEPGLRHHLTMDFSYFSGNAEIIQLMGSYRMDYLLQSSWYGFLSGQYNRAFEKDQEDFSNRGFIHLRSARPVMARIDIEGFLQKEANHFINLENRELIGGGLRINQFEELYFGVGFMHEMEKYNDNPQEQNVIKSTNYINYKTNILQNAELQNVIYYQFQMEQPGDFRILWDGKLSVYTSRGISLYINTHYRFDKNSENYFEISNGIGFQF